MRTVGTVVRGIRTPIIKANDDLANIVVDSLLKAKENEGFEFKDKDVVAVTEAVIAISEGNYATVDDIAEDIRRKFPNGDIGLVYPILSRNRFSIVLKGIARACNHITMLLSFPNDEVGNGILDEDLLYDNNYSLDSVISEEEYFKTFGSFLHPFTGINMVKFYKELVESENCKIDFVFSNKPQTILEYKKDILVGSIHSRKRVKKILKNSNASAVLGLDDILTEPINRKRL